MPKITDTKKKAKSKREKEKPEKKVHSAEEVSIATREAIAAGLTFTRLSSEIKNLEKQMDGVKKHLKAYVETFGDEDPNTGHITAILEHADKEIVLKNTCRVQTTMEANALDTLKKELSDKPLILKKLVETTEVIRTDRLQEMATAHKLPEGLLSEMFSVKSTYAFTCTLRDKITDES